MEKWQTISLNKFLHMRGIFFLDSWNPAPQLPSENEFCGAYTSCAVWGCSVHDKKGFNLFPPLFLLNLCNLDSLK